MRVGTAETDDQRDKISSTGWLTRLYRREVIRRTRMKVDQRTPGEIGLRCFRLKILQLYACGISGVRCGLLHFFPLLEKVPAHVRSNPNGPSFNKNGTTVALLKMKRRADEQWVSRLR